MNSICAFANDINIGVCLNKLKTDKKYKKTTMKEIVLTFCALVNSHGGRATLKLESGSASDIECLKRAIEQRLSDILGFSAMRDLIDLVSSSSSSDELVFIVEEVSSLCTVNYNLYMPTETQVLAVPSKTSIADVQEVLSTEKRIVEVEELVEKGTHYKECVLQQNISDQPRESKTVQFKCLKAEKSKCVSLGDRMTNKSNKFPNYVSAFANHHGGHIYYGVDDDGVVKGEVVKDKEEITKKVRKAINKMVWPTECGGPKREQHWDIFFEPVNDVNGNVVPFMFVIVIYVARCAGGVFTEEPESYHTVKGEVKKMEFEEWRRRLFLDTVPQNVARAQWSSRKTELLINSVTAKMVSWRNSGEKEAFVRFAMQVKEKYPSSEALLTILSQEAVFACRRNELVKAEKSIDEYKSVLHNNSGDNENYLSFMALEAFIRSAKERSAAKYKLSYNITTSALQNLEFVPPGFYSAWLYLQAASLLTTLAYDRDCQDRFDMVALAKQFNEKALEHVSYVPGFSNIVADVRQNAYTQIASLYLACSRTGTIDITAVVSQDDITRGKNCLMMVDKLVVDGYPLNSLRQIQYFLAQSSLFLRHSQQPSTTTQQSRRSLLESSFQYSEKALKLAIECHFGEMVLYSRQKKASVTEEIIRESVRNLRLKKTELLDES